MKKSGIEAAGPPLLAALAVGLMAPNAAGPVRRTAGKLQTELTSRFTPLRKFEEFVKQVPARKMRELDLASRFELLESTALQAQGDALFVSRKVSEAVGPHLGRFEDGVKALLDDTANYGRFLRSLSPEARLNVNLGIQALDEISADVIKEELAAGRISRASADTLGTPQARIKAAMDVQLGKRAKRKPRTLEEISAVLAAGRGPREFNRRLNNLADVALSDPGRAAGFRDPVHVIRPGKDFKDQVKALKARGFQVINFKRTGPIEPTLKTRVNTILEKLRARDEGRIAKLPKTEETKTWGLAVSGDIANSLKDLGPDKVMTLARMGQRFNTLFRFGTTIANAPFQVVNVALRDPMRLAILGDMSGVRLSGQRMVETMRAITRDPGRVFDLFALEFFGTLAESAAANGIPLRRVSDTYIDFLRSGSAGSGFQRYFQPEQFLDEPQQLSRTQRAVRPLVLISNSLEETAKLLGFKRGLRRLGSNPTAEDVEKLASEIRKFAGSPDFFRKGAINERGKDLLTKLNFWFVFFNARLQGNAADLSVLTGRHGAKRAVEGWTKLTAAAAIPALMAYKINSDTREKEWDGPLGKIKMSYHDAWSSLAEHEKEQILIPMDTYHVDEKGRVKPNYIKVPIADTPGMIAKATNRFARLLTGDDPELAAKIPIGLLEDLSPVNIEGETLEERVESMAGSLQPLARAPMEFLAGRNFFQKRDVTPEFIGPSKSSQLEPGERFTARTGEIFKRLGQAINVDPNKLEQLARTSTGGLSDTIARAVSGGRDLLPGQPAVAGTPVLGDVVRRFMGGFSAREDAELLPIAQETSREVAAFKVGIFREAQQEMERLSGLPAEERTEEFLRLKEERPALAHRIDLELAKRDITHAKSVLKRLSPMFRAQALIEILAPLPEKERVKRYVEFQEDGIVTKETQLFVDVLTLTAAQER
ncbi:MAG: LPD38 domain-containing protein [Acidobacteriota bacterium]